MSIFNGVQSSGSASRIRCPLHSTVCFPFMFLMWMPIATCSYILLHFTFLISLIRWRNLANQLEFQKHVSFLNLRTSHYILYLFAKNPRCTISSGQPNSSSPRLCALCNLPQYSSVSMISCSSQASGEYCSLKTYDSMIVSDIPSSLEPDSETGPSPVTLALLLKDVTRF